MITSTGEQYMTYEEAAAHIDSTVNALRSAVSRGLLANYRPLRSKKIYLKRADVERYGKGERPETKQEAPALGVDVPPELARVLPLLLPLVTAIGERFTAIAGEYRATLGALFQAAAPAPAMAPPWLANILGKPDATPEEAQEMVDHLPEMWRSIFPGAPDLTAQEMATMQPALREGMMLVQERVAQAQTREKVPA